MINIAQQINDVLVAADCHQIHAVYTGIGSRSTPHEVLYLMTSIATKLDVWGWTMRSGGADGADTAFEGSSRKEIYLPWRGFNGKQGTTPTQSVLDKLRERFTYTPEPGDGDGGKWILRSDILNAIDEIATHA